MIIEMTPLYGFISTGDKTMMYTLRIMYDVVNQIGPRFFKEKRDYHVFNLSTDQDLAEKKALKYLEGQDLKLHGGAEFDLNEIRRRKSEEVQREREEQQRKIQQEEEEFLNKNNEEFQTGVTDAVFIIGKYTGMTADEVAEIDVNYIRWLANNEVSETFKNKFDVNVQIAKNYVSTHELHVSEFIGEIGDVIQLDVKLIDRINLDGRFFTTLWKCITPDGDNVVFFSTAKKFYDLNNGDSFIVKGTVKEHKKFRDQKSTTIGRPKIV